MERRFIIGKTLEKALEKYPLDHHVNIIELENPLKLESSVLELKIIFGYLANNKNQILTPSEERYLKWIKRVYPELLKYRHFSIAIEFTTQEKEAFIKCMKEYYSKETISLSNIYRIYRLSA